MFVIGGGLGAFVISTGVIRRPWYRSYVRAHGRPPS